MWKAVRNELAHRTHSVKVIIMSGVGGGITKGEKQEAPSRAVFVSFLHIRIKRSNF